MISMAFVFGTLVEFALVLFLNQTFKGKSNATNDSSNGLKSANEYPKKVFVIKGREEKTKIRTVSLSKKLPFAGSSKKELVQLGITGKIDSISFVVFNFSYFVFNVIYWTSY